MATVSLGQHHAVGLKGGGLEEPLDPSNEAVGFILRNQQPLCHEEPADRGLPSPNNAHAPLPRFVITAIEADENGLAMAVFQNLPIWRNAAESFFLNSLQGFRGSNKTKPQKIQPILPAGGSERDEGGGPLRRGGLPGEPAAAELVGPGPLDVRRRILKFHRTCPLYRRPQITLRIRVELKGAELLGLSGSGMSPVRPGQTGTPWDTPYS